MRFRVYAVILAPTEQGPKIEEAYTTAYMSTRTHTYTDTHTHTHRERERESERVG